MGAVELLLLPCLHKSADESSWGVKRERNVPVVESWEQSRVTESSSWDNHRWVLFGMCCRRRPSPLSFTGYSFEILENRKLCVPVKWETEVPCFAFDLLTAEICLQTFCSLFVCWLSSGQVTGFSSGVWWKCWKRGFDMIWINFLRCFV